jgi:uncharacterized RDD family membrane protein YckC
VIGETAPARDVGLQGHYAGIASRFAAFIVDVFTVTASFAVGGRVFEYVVSTLRGDPFSLSDAPVFSTVALAAWAFVYCAYPLAVSGRTVGLAVAGLRVVRRDGHDLDARHAVLRVLAFPLSFLVFGLGFILILVNREHRALHDLIARTAVVYEWDARAARLRLLSKGRTA